MRFGEKVMTSFDGLKTVEVEVHETLESFIEAEWKCPFAEFLDCKIGGFDDDGKEFESPAREILDAIRAQGISGFCDTKKNTIHLWLDPKCVDPEDLICCLAHEYSHTCEERDLTTNEGFDPEEFWAERASDAAKFGYRMMKNIINHYRDNGEAGDMDFM